MVFRPGSHSSTSIVLLAHFQTRVKDERRLRQAKPKRSEMICNVWRRISVLRAEQSTLSYGYCSACRRSVKSTHRETLPVSQSSTTSSTQERERERASETNRQCIIPLAFWLALLLAKVMKTLEPKVNKLISNQYIYICVCVGDRCSYIYERAPKTEKL